MSAAFGLFWAFSSRYDKVDDKTRSPQNDIKTTPTDAAMTYAVALRAVTVPKTPKTSAAISSFWKFSSQYDTTDNIDQIEIQNQP